LAQAAAGRRQHLHALLGQAPPCQPASKGPSAALAPCPFVAQGVHGAGSCAALAQAQLHAPGGR